MSPSDPASPRQLNLAFGYRESFDRMDFLCGRGNETALALIDASSVPQALSSGALAIEDADRGELDEAALFHLLNLAREQSAHILITARQAPATWPIKLPDLASRLRALPVAALDPPDDALLAAVLVKLFADRQLAVDERLIEFLVHRIERSFAAARAAVAELDHEAMRLKRPVNRALAAEILRGRSP